MMKNEPQKWGEKVGASINYCTIKPYSSPSNLGCHIEHILVLLISNVITQAHFIGLHGSTLTIPLID